MSVFDDEDEQEEGTAGARVAAALNPQDEDEPADDGPDTRSDSQKDAQDQAKGDQQEDDSASAVASGRPYTGKDDSDEDTQPADESDQAFRPSEDEGVPMEGEGAGIALAPPKAPTLTPYSTAPAEAAQQLAQAKSDFAGRVAAGNYRPSVWRRLGAGLAGGAVAFGSNPEEGVRTVDRALQAPLNRARQVEEAKEQGIQSQIDAGNLANQRAELENKNKLTQYGVDERQFRDTGDANDRNAQAVYRRAQARAKLNTPQSFVPDDPSDPYKGGTLTTVGGKVTKGVPPPDEYIAKWAKTPDGIAATTRMNVNARRQVADSIFGKGNSQEKQEFVATGKVSHSARVSVPSAAKEEFDDWKTAFQKENGRAPNAAEIAGWGHGKSGATSKNLMDRIESQKNTQLAKTEAEFKSKDPRKKISKDEFLNRWQSIQDDYEQRLSDATGQDIPHVTIRDNVDPNTLQWHGKAPASPNQNQRAAPPSGRKVSLAQARQLPINKGKSDAQIKADIEAHGHLAVP